MESKIPTPGLKTGPDFLIFNMSSMSRVTCGPIFLAAECSSITSSLVFLSCHNLFIILIVVLMKLSQNYEMLAT